VTTAKDIVAVLFSVELHLALAVKRGWSHSRCTNFFRETLTAQLVAGGP